MNHGVEIFNHDDWKRHQFWNTAPFDPLAEAKKTGQAHHARVTKGVLFPQSSMPLGLHVGKIMERVPPEYLLWVYEQHWSKASKWQPVRDYIDRHLEDIKHQAGQGDA
jgi:hypothetical protein